MKRKVSAIFTVAIMMIMYMGLSFDVNAAEPPKDYLPEGWTRIETDSLSSEQIEAIAAAICDKDNIIQPREPAPPLTSLDIIDLAIDDNNEIHVVTQEIGTSKPGLRFVYWNGSMCEENIYETQLLTGADRIVYGYIRYFHTGIYYSSSLSGTVVRVTAKSTNAMNPWNTLNASATFTLP